MDLQNPGSFMSQVVTGSDETYDVVGMADLLFGKATVGSAYAAHRLLNEDRTYFKQTNRMPPRFQPRSEADVRAIIAKREAEERVRSFYQLVPRLLELKKQCGCFGSIQKVRMMTRAIVVCFAAGGKEAGRLRGSAQGAPGKQNTRGCQSRVAVWASCAAHQIDRGLCPAEGGAERHPDCFRNPAGAFHYLSLLVALTSCSRL